MNGDRRAVEPDVYLRLVLGGWSEGTSKSLALESST